MNIIPEDIGKIGRGPNFQGITDNVKKFFVYQELIIAFCLEPQIF